MKKQNYVQRHFCRVSPIFFGLLTQETKKKRKEKKQQEHFQDHQNELFLYDDYK